MEFTKDFWEKIYNKNMPMMIGVCRRYIGDPILAEDLMHDAFLNAMTKIDGYQAKGNIEAWLRKIAINAALMHLRYEKMKKIHQDAIVYEIEIENRNMTELNEKTVRSIIENACFTELELLEITDQLAEHHKLVFNMYVIDGYSHNEIAKELSISSGTSKSHLARARKKIKELLYEKALQKNTDENRKQHKKLSILFFPSTVSYIDSIYKKSFKHFYIYPQNHQFSDFCGINMSSKSMPATFSVKASKLYTILLASSAIVVSTTAILFYNSSQTKQSDVILFDSIKHKNTTVTIEQKIDSTPIASKQPIVIQKVVIKKQTITIRDTIKIIDSSNVQ